MKKRTVASGPGVGGVSLLVIFAVLCLCVLSLLSLSAVLAQQRMTETSVQSAAVYYEADLQAQAVFARLRNGELVPGVREENGVFAYTCGISDNQQLEVQLQREGENWKILRWQAVAQEETAEDALPVWSGK